MTNYKYYHFFQPNPEPSKRKGDCVIRALCVATDQDWLTVFDEIVQIARKQFDIINGNNVYPEYLKKYGFTEYKVTNKKGTKRPTMKSLIKQYPDKIIVGHCSKHVTCAKNGKVYDTWDTTERPLYKYWVK